ncbi:hypothetical protein ACFV3E_44915 [Streptomyces sp. NPDC059718]
MNRVLWTVLAFILSVLAVSGLTSAINGAVGANNLPSILVSLAVSTALFFAARGAWRQVIRSQ